MLHHFFGTIYLTRTIRSAPTYLSFRKSLKTYFFNQAFPIDCLPCINLTHLVLTVFCTFTSLSGQVGFEP